MTSKQAAVDPLSGKMDMNTLAAGMNTSSSKMVQQVAKEMAEFLDHTETVNVSTKNLYKSMRQINKALQRGKFDEALNDLPKMKLVVQTGERIRYLGIKLRSRSR